MIVINLTLSIEENFGRKIGMLLLNRIVFFINDVLESGGGSSLNKPKDNATTGPIYDFLDTFGPVLIALLLAVGVVYCIVLGVQYAKAEKGDDRDTAKKKAVNAAISFVVIIVLVVLLYAFRGTFNDLLMN